jgi:hypothetical protein
LKAVYRILVSRIKTKGAFKPVFDTDNLHRPTVVDDEECFGLGVVRDAGV